MHSNISNPTLAGHSDDRRVSRLILWCSRKQRLHTIKTAEDSTALPHFHRQIHASGYYIRSCSVEICFINTLTHDPSIKQYVASINKNVGGSLHSGMIRSVIILDGK